jgi:hypothetical protein
MGQYIFSIHIYTVPPLSFPRTVRLLVYLPCLPSLYKSVFKAFLIMTFPYNHCHDQCLLDATLTAFWQPIRKHHFCDTRLRFLCSSHCFASGFYSMVPVGLAWGNYSCHHLIERDKEVTYKWGGRVRNFRLLIKAQASKWTSFLIVHSEQWRLFIFSKKSSHHRR